MAPPTPAATSKPIYFFSTRERPHGIFSQFQKCSFTDPDYPNVKFTCAEQYMMHGKAQTFDNPDIAAQILAATASKAQKALGRKIKGFSDRVWDPVKLGIVERGNYLKFSQKEKFKKVLLDTGDRLIVEASADDKIWGIGYNATGAEKVSRERWGQNLLGIALMNVREKIRAEEAREEEDEEEAGEEEEEEDDDDDDDEEEEVDEPVKQRKYDSITEDQTDEPTKSEKTLPKKTRVTKTADVNEGLRQILNAQKGRHHKDEQTAEDDLLELLTKKAAEDSMINGK
ncbi:unnamed protein product [Aureobasidium uvarum]|uniref:NADAR domain-containing protein n=1 Tax=Aureobasidium uvarum TaxID=2773716 RepID=A0A9N8KL26_9PEZI|nr:unnamed protein product [Aureobasidium uvarum]